MVSAKYVALFYIRLAIYLVAYLLPVFHPAIVVSYDSATVWLWFLLVPLQMHLAFFGQGRLRFGILLGISAAVALISVAIIPGFDLLGWLFAYVQIGAFLLTYILFTSRVLGRYTGILELGIIAFIYVRLIGFSRASETFADASGAITQAVLAFSLGSILLHSFVLYLAVFREGVQKRTLREIAIFTTAAAILGIIVALVMPPNFVNHNVVLNELRDPPQPEFQSLDGETNGLDGGNLRPNQNRDDEGDGGSEGGNENGEGEEGQTGSLQGINADEWENRRGNGEGDGEGSGNEESKQYAVMVVGSKHDPVYAAEAYYGSYDTRRGFVRTPDQPLNNLTYTRLLETWRNPSPAIAPMREDTDVFILSTIPERVVPYDPIAIEPTVLNTRYHPFDFAYSVTSGISRSEPDQWRRIAPLSPSEREEYADYLEYEIPDEHRPVIEKLAENLFTGRAGYYARLEAILALYTTYQYEIGFTDDVTIDAISNFLFSTRTGDCTEFSNATALLARIGGIPSRVVTGYLATEGLQTPNHTQGLVVLQQSIEPLAQFPLEDLFLVTTAHHHSWVQILMPGYGWVDVETTSTALAPVGSGDPNAMDIVIPIITPEEIVQRNFEFPWLLVGQTILVLSLAGLAAAYLFRFGRRLYLSRLARGASRQALSALYTLLLSHLATEGYPLKPDSETSVEYSERHPELREFADAYTRLRYSSATTGSEDNEKWDSMRDTYRTTKKLTRRTGASAFVKRIASLRELRY